MAGKKLPPINMREEFSLNMKFYWAREHQKKPEDERMFTGGVCGTVPGANNLCPVFLDYDWTNLQEVEESVKSLQEKWELGNAYVYSSLGKEFYHVKCYYDWVGFEQLLEILKSDKRIDEGFVKMGEKKGFTVLRTCAKPNRAVPEFVKIMESVHQKNKTREELDWGDMLRLSVESLIGQKETWINDFRQGELLETEGKK